MSARNVFLKYEEQQPNESRSSSNEIRQTLDQIFPPTENGQIRVSAKLAAIYEILDLEKDLKSKLRDIKNGVQGFSPEISQVYQQLFEELIRQETIACPERGRLLQMVLDENILSVRNLQKCVKSSFSNAVCKNLLLRRSILGMGGEVPNLENRLRGAEILLETMQRQRKERLQEMEDSERLKTVEYEFGEDQLERKNQEMVKDLEDIIDEEHRWLKDINEEEEEHRINS